MLQQTQVERVVPFYTRFIRQFPTTQKLAKAPLSKVLKAWSGLGYNRRAVYLWRSAEILSKKSSGLPSGAQSGPAGQTFSQGISASCLPGVGPYTAAAVEAFAFNKPTVFIETNIRTVFIHHFFHSHILENMRISDKEILPLVEKALKKSKMPPREFYWALMDYGTLLKKQGIKLNSRSLHYNKQSKFEGSYRQLRGQILRSLLTEPSTLNQLLKTTGRKKSDVVRVLANLTTEELVKIKNHQFSIVD
ncbi:MAG: A/G-specific adenine glycosylase [Candidatus Adlerbacteria bacterium]|nr:A/G-specific adenine glycosylase [Candidatus Adlerbacteria bacterium]